MKYLGGANYYLLNRDLVFLNEYRTSIGIKLLLLYLLCYTTNDPSAQRKQFFADSKDALKLYRIFRNEELQPMLIIYFGDMPSAIYNTEIYFKNTYEDSWILDDFAKKVIKKVDGSDVIAAQAIKSPVLGIIPPTELSGGVKTLLLIKNCPDEVFNASTCGDNCARFILELAKAKDVTINLRHIMDSDKARFTAKILNDDSIVHNMEELLPIAARYV